MGLDTVELVMAFEEEFGIHIDNDVAEKCGTPQDVADYVFTRVRTSADDSCPSQRGFYKLRKIVTTTFNKKRSGVSPNTSLKEIFSDDIASN